MVEGFPSKGFVSTITANYMIRELDMELVGYIESDELSSITVIKDSKPLRPIRIYTKGSIVLIYSEIMVPFKSIPEISRAINSWIEELKPRQVILMAGISGAEAEQKGHQILGVASDEKLARKLGEMKVTLVKDGVLTGVSSNILMHCVEKRIPVAGLMVETECTPDALAAASMLDILNGLLGISINSQMLRRMGKDIEEDFRKIMKQMKKGREGYVKMEECGPMYG